VPVAPPPQQPVVSVRNKAEAAAYLGVGVRTVERLMAKGKLVPARVGGKCVVSWRMDLDRYVEREVARSSR
jgi:excisionase family DNA binding protein